MNEKLLNELTIALGDNRGLAKRAICLFEGYNLYNYVRENCEDFEDISEDELRDYFFDLAYEWCDENENVAFFVDVLTALDCNYERNCGIGYLADLMAIYYKYVDKDENVFTDDNLID